MALDREVRAFALVKSHLHDEVFPKYPEIAAKLQKESFENYNKFIFAPLNNQRQSEVQNLNKKSVYRQIKITDVKNLQGDESSTAMNQNDLTKSTNMNNLGGPSTSTLPGVTINGTL